MRCQFTEASFSDSLFFRYGVPESALVARAVRKRRAEYLAARYLCKIMLEEWGELSVVRSGINREPLWPQGWTGSITHSGNTAISCVARTDEVSMLGMDFEHWIGEDLAAEIAGMIIDDGERSLLQHLWSFSKALTLAFSAKESLYKAIYPVVGKVLDFHCARLVDINMAAGKFSLEIGSGLSPELQAGRKFTGYFASEDNAVHTIVAEPAGSYKIS
jgi:enterobactin synthetase component D